MQPTNQQVAFLDALVDSTDNLALVARAGCGKTSTILLGVDALVKRHPNIEIGICAFNKAIADEIGTKLKQRGHTNWKQVSASTLHSLGYGLIKWMFKPRIEDSKVRDLIQAHCPEGRNWNQEPTVWEKYGTQIAHLVGVAKGAGVGFFSDLPIESAHIWYQLADHYDINGLDDMREMQDVVQAAQQIYVESLNQTDVIDFDDMILWPLIKNLSTKFGKDVLFVDEAQDLSRAKQALARKFVRARTGRMVVVGDDRQAIYGFAGADAAALPNLIQMLHARVMPLTVTWRCPKSVVKLAQGLVPDIEYAPTAAEGSVSMVTALPDLKTTDAILCRNTAPLISIAYSLIRKGVPCKVEGRAIGDGMIKLAQRWKVADIDGLLERLEQYREREVQKAQAKGNEAKVDEVNDRVDTLVEICNACILQGQQSIQDVVNFINRLFADSAKGVVTLATYHRSKGREWPRVFLWEHYQRCPARGARQPWQIQQENNLAYVAWTRAQEQLVFIDPSYEGED